MPNRGVYNPYFFVPFLLWLILGGWLYGAYNKEILFRFVNAHHTPFLDELMYHATDMGEAIVVVPVLLLFLLHPRFRNWQYLVLAGACNAIPMLVQQSLKSFFNKPRPLNYFHNAEWIHRLPHWPELHNRSFPSGHTEGAFAFFCFMSMMFLPKYKGLGVLFFALAILVGYSRIYLAAHFYEDVYVGSIVGVVICSIVFTVGNKLLKVRNHGDSVKLVG